MTTIILVAIGVLIAGAAALFMIFYGGDAYNESAVKSEAARLIAEGSQIEYATDLYYREQEQMPGRKADGTLDGQLALEDLKAKKYLNHIPAGTKLTTVADWKMEYGADGMIYSRLGSQTDEAALRVCREARKQQGFQQKDADGKTPVYKCDGSDYFDSRWHSSGTLPVNEPCCIRG